MELSLMLITLLIPLSRGNTVQLTSDNLDKMLASTELVFINFYAKWCQFSKILSPIYEDMAVELQKEYGVDKVVFGKVEAEEEVDLARRYKIRKYPTLKMFRYGEPVKREYRGQRSVQSLVDFVRHQLKDPVLNLTSADELANLEWKKRNVVGYFDADASSDYEVFHRVASMLREDCLFYAFFSLSDHHEELDETRIHFRMPLEEYADIVYRGQANNYTELLKWTTDMCIPFVREILFENAEELAEEGLPLMILFHHEKDTETPRLFLQCLTEELNDERNAVTFLTANGLKFMHPLKQVGKTISDLPVVVIDTFRHMYLWKHNPRTDLCKPGLLKQFVEDLHSEKLHREFHRSTSFVDGHSTKLEREPKWNEHDGKLPSQRIGQSDNVASPSRHKAEPTEKIPESAFIKLAPSKNRYTLLRDEL